MSRTASPSVSYEVHVLPMEHELRVEMTVRGPAARGTLRLEVPTWVPGDYAFLPFARDLFDLRAQDADSGRALTMAREGWQAYRVEGGQGAVRVSYRAYAYEPEFSEPCGIVDSDNAVLLGARYLRVPAAPGPCRVTYHLPPGWEVHHPSGATRAGSTTAWVYPSYEVLLDTPVVLGRFDLVRRNVRGTPFYFAFVDRTLGFDQGVQRFVDGLVGVAEECHRVFGSFPFEDYTFVLSFSPDREWGLEHQTSSMCGLGPDLFLDSGRTAYGLRVCAHELFHAWNVRRLRPAPLRQLDLTRGSFTEGLWLAEGFTRYYEFLLCTRTRAYTPEQFFSSVVNYHRHLAAVPAFGRVSAVDSSLAAYLNHDKYPGRCNNSIDYYDKGMLIAFELDAALRLQDKNDTLDDAFREFYQRFANSSTGHTTAQVIDFFEGRCPGLGDMLRRAAGESAGLEIESYLRWLGFRVRHEEVRYLGLLFNDSQGPAIYNVLDDSPAGRGAVAPGDVLTRVNGYPFRMAALAWAVRHLDEVVLDLHRGPRCLRVALAPDVRNQIASLAWDGSEAEAERIRTWLRREDFRPAMGQPLSLDFYENFHGIETLV